MTKSNPATGTVGTPIREEDTSAAEAEADRIATLINHPEAVDNITFYQYEDEDVWGHRLEIDTLGLHIIPDAIDTITEQTSWSFIGVKDAAVMFEGSIPDTPADQTTSDYSK